MAETNSLESKKINITGTSNRYQIKKLTKKSYDKENKKRVETEKWTFSEEHYKYENQLNMIQDISKNNFNHVDEVSKIAIQQINKKLNGYKHQDVIKKHLNEKDFLTFESIINKMIECELKCRYCKKGIAWQYPLVEIATALLFLTSSQNLEINPLDSISK